MGRTKKSRDKSIYRTIIKKSEMTPTRSYSFLEYSYISYRIDNNGHISNYYEVNTTNDEPLDILEWKMKNDNTKGGFS